MPGKRIWFEKAGSSFFCIALMLGMLLASPARANFVFKNAELDEVGITVGTWLPWGGLPGVRDQYRMWGISYFHPSSIWNLEYQFMSARGYGVTAYNFSAGLKIDIVIEQTLELFLLGGLDYFYYQRAPNSWQSFGYVHTGGIHMGFGGFFAFSEHVKLRSELKFFNGPGKTIYLGVGPTILF